MLADERSADLQRSWRGGETVDERGGRPEHPEESQEERPAKLDIRAVWQLTSMSVGAGVFTVPGVFVRLGILPAATWLCILSLLANVALQRLLDLAAAKEVTTYEDLADLGFGVTGKYTMLVITFVAPLIASLSYATTSRSLLVDAAVAFLVGVDVHAAPVGVEVISNRKQIVLLSLLVAAVLPLCLSSSMGGKAWLSTMCVFSMMASCLFFLGRCVPLLFYGCNSGIQCGAPPPLLTWSLPDSLECGATLAFSFSIVFAIFPALQERAIAVGGSTAKAVKQMKPAVRCSVALLCVMYGMIGLVGSMTFGSSTKTIALSNLPLNEPMAQLITFTVGVSMELLVAIVSFPCLQSMQQFLTIWCGSQHQERAWPWLVVLLGAIIIIVDSFLPTKVAFALGGSLGLSLAAYLVPGLLFLRLARACSPQSRNRNTRSRVEALVVCLCGAALLLLATPVTLFRLLYEGDGNSPTPQQLHSFICSVNSTFLASA